MKRILLLGAGAFALIVLVGALLLYLNRDKIASYAMDRTLSKVEGTVIQNIPDSKAADAARTDFATLHDRLHSGSLKADDIKDLTAIFYSSYKDGRIDSASVRQIVERVHKLNEKK